jgi:hypothetical protein
MKSVTFTHDELILVMISLVRAVHPSMLRQEADGFSVDFELLDNKKELDDDERLLFKVRALLDSPIEAPARTATFDDKEGRRLVGVMAELLRLQTWPTDVVEMCRSLRTRLLAVPSSE